MTMPNKSFLSSCKLFTPNIVLTTVHKGVEALLINLNNMLKIFDGLSYYGCEKFTVENL